MLPSPSDPEDPQNPGYAGAPKAQAAAPSSPTGPAQVPGVNRNLHPGQFGMFRKLGGMSGIVERGTDIAQQQRIFRSPGGLTQALRYTFLPPEKAGMSGTTRRMVEAEAFGRMAQGPGQEAE